MTESPDTGLKSLDDALRDAVSIERGDCLRGPDSPEGRELGKMVGANVARVRARRGLGLAALAERSGITEDLLGLLEGGKAVPSLRAVWALASALSVPFGALLAPTGAGAENFHVQHAGRGRVIASSSGAFRSRALSPAGHPDAPEVYELTLTPGCLEEAAAHAPDTFEHIVVVRGTLIVRVWDAMTRLGPGDAVFFRADQPHSYENPTSEDVVAHLVMSYAVSRDQVTDPTAGGRNPDTGSPSRSPR
jgi:quercetin dioxygenase-like cupin family protein/DNA-binding XRE family transcriptional regulator